MANQNLSDRLNDNTSTAFAIPSGVVFPFAGTTAPGGFLICDGSAVSRTTYAALFAVIGTAHGHGDGSTTFNLPDLRGKFIRGTDNMGTGAAGNDPDTATRTAAATGGNTGDAIGSVQSGQFASHGHSYYLPAGSNSTNSPPQTPSQLLFSSGNTGSANGSVATVTASGMSVSGYNNGGFASGAFVVEINSSGGNETRPLNVYLHYIIKS